MHIEFPPVEVKIEGMETISIPPMLRIRQKYDADRIEALRPHIFDKLSRLDVRGLKDKSICITVGSRGIPHMAEMYKAVCDFLLERARAPF